MTKTLEIPDGTRAAQRQAASPAHSAWVSANAGSGKTEILVQRVIRLLLEGARPSSILCLTFTKAAAAEMMSRVFKRLGEWIALPDHQLSNSVENLTGRTPTGPILTRARRLFAEALETPGGLKVQTIHAFCEHLLHLFPIDANVPANFTVMDETDQRRMCQALLMQLIAEKANGTDDERSALTVIAEALTPETLEELTREALSNDNLFTDIRSSQSARASYRNRLRQMAGIDEDENIDSICAGFFHSSFWTEQASQLADLLELDSSKHNNATARCLRQILNNRTLPDNFAHFHEHLMTDKNTVRANSRLITNKLRERYPELAAQFDETVAQAILAQERIMTIRSIERSWSGISFLAEFVKRYKLAKSQRGILDFDDLIGKTRTLLYRDDIAPWILYKLDYGLSHILIDEAQDTSPEQWDIITKLAEEFTVGDSSHSGNRTVFAVGDEKQSIYGFQGAAPELFSHVKRMMDKRHRNAGRILKDVRLLLSFRSTEEVLSAVDQTFSHGSNVHGLVFDGTSGAMVHESLRRSEPGFVELWPQEHGIKADETPDPWADTADESENTSARQALADRIARYIRYLLRHGDATGRAVRAGNIMILVRHRGALFETLIQALKFHNLPVAGADRLKLKSHIAVKDLLALGRACLIPDDDLNLAVLLKSPLFGMSDDDLLKFAPLRPGSLNAALQAHAENTGTFRDLWEQLQRWRQKAALSGPFEFYTHVMETEGGRRAMLQRLGPESADAMDEFLHRTHEFELRRHASLMAFLIEFENADIEIKRDFAHGGDEIRIMTVHAAKGLEAPIVILPDTMSPPKSHKARILGIETPSGQLLPFWSPSPREETSLVGAARAREALETENEYRRLLYVAMTRAQNGLLICGARHDAAKAGSWYHMIHSALHAPLSLQPGRPQPKLEALPGFDGHTVERWLVTRRPEQRAIGAVPEKKPAAPVLSGPLPEWVLRPAPPRERAQEPLAPSQAGLPVATATGDRKALLAARSRGKLVHALLEHLPELPAGERSHAAAVIAQRVPAAAEARETAIAQALALLELPAMQILFGAGARAEVAMSGHIRLADGSSAPVLGVVDRLVVRDDAIWVADFKSNPFPPRNASATPESIVAQLALYRAILREIYPGRPVRCLVVWTAAPAVHELSEAQLDAAMAHVTAA